MKYMICLSVCMSVWSVCPSQVLTLQVNAEKIMVKSKEPKDKITKQIISRNSPNDHGIGSTLDN